MKITTLIVALLFYNAIFPQIAGTSFEEPNTYSGKYTDTGDASTAHDLLNNTNEPMVDFASTGGELGFNARYVPYDTPDVGLTDGDDVGVTDKNPSSSVTFVDGSKGYRMSDLDGNFILEFDDVDLTSYSNPGFSIDYLLSINSNPANGNYEGDGTSNEAGSDRLRIYLKDIVNNEEIDVVNSTGMDLDELVPFNTSTGEYQFVWQNALVAVTPSLLQLVIEGRTNAGTESFWFDNIMFVQSVGTPAQTKNEFSLYPNPTSSGYVNIISTVGGTKDISIFNVLGRRVLTAQLNSDRLNISALNSGVYIIKIVAGKASATKKLIVK